jgi:hypothetical protein
LNFEGLMLVTRVLCGQRCEKFSSHCIERSIKIKKYQKQKQQHVSSQQSDTMR